MPDPAKRIASRAKRKRDPRFNRRFASDVDPLLMTIVGARRIAAKHPRISPDPLTKLKREPRKIASIAKAR